MLSVIRAFTFVFFFSLIAKAQVDYFRTQKLYMPAQIENTLPMMQFSHKVTSNIELHDNSQTAVSKMLDNSFSFIWENSDLKKTAVGQTMETVEKKMRADVDLGVSNSEDAKKVNHRLSFGVLAAQALAKIEYFGWFKACLKYDARNAASVAEVSENLDNNKDLVISHSTTKEENRSQVSLRWDW